MSKEIKEEPKLPPPITQAFNFASSMAKFVKSGLKFTSKAVYSNRLAMCTYCDKLRHSDGRCSECGCYVEAKAEISSEACPLGKWPAVKEGKTLRRVGKKVGTGKAVGSEVKKGKCGSCNRKRK